MAVTDQEVQSSGQSASASAGTTGTTAQPVELAVAIEADRLTSGTRTTPSGWTNRVNKINSSYGSIEIADRFLSAIGTVSGAWTISSSTYWSALIQTFLCSSTPALVGVLNSGQAHGSGSGTNTIAVAVPAGSLVVVGAHVYGTQTLSSCTDSQGNSYTIVNAPNTGGNSGVVCALAWSLVTTALSTSDTFSCATSGGGNLLVGAVAYSGVGVPGVSNVGYTVVSQAVNRAATY